MDEMIGAWAAHVKGAGIANWLAWPWKNFAMISEEQLTLYLLLPQDIGN